MDFQVSYQHENSGFRLEIRTKETDGTRYSKVADFWLTRKEFVAFKALLEIGAGHHTWGAVEIVRGST